MNKIYQCLTGTGNCLFNALSYLFNRAIECCTKGKTQPKAKIFSDDTTAIVDLETSSTLRNRRLATSPQNNTKVEVPIATAKTSMSIEERTRNMNKFVDHILNKEIIETEQLQNILNKFVDRLIDEEPEIRFCAGWSLKQIIENGKIIKPEIANVLVDRLLGLLKEVRLIEGIKGMSANIDQLRMLECLSSLMKLVKIEDPKKLDEIVMSLIEISKNTNILGPDRVLEALKNLHETSNNSFRQETLTTEIAFLEGIRKTSPWGQSANWNSSLTLNTRFFAGQVLIQILLNEHYGNIISFKRAMGW